MKQLTFVLLVIVLMLIFWKMAGAQEPVLVPVSAPTSTPVSFEDGRIDGTVLLQGRNDHGGVDVCVNFVCVETDSDGSYSIYMSEGSYQIIADMERYLDAEDSVVVTSSKITPMLPVTCLGGDTNDDCVINILDIALMGGRFGMSCGDSIWDSRADINDDCTVNILDLAMTGGNFSKSCPVLWPLPTPTPPPIP